MSLNLFHVILTATKSAKTSQLHYEITTQLLYSSKLNFSGFLPFSGVFFEEACEEVACVVGNGSGETDGFQENEFEQHFWVSVVEGKTTTHHLVRDHARAPPVDRTTVVVVLQNLKHHHNTVR